MTERIGFGYKILFEVRLLHHYWLDEGASVFDLIADADKKNNRLLAYDRRPFLSVTPVASTAKTLKALNCVYKDTALGFIVATTGFQVIPPDALFEFVITITNTAFFNYTALTLQPQKISEVYHQPENKTYRYKENVFVFSNKTGASRGAGNNKTLFLSAKYPVRSASDKIESLVIVSGALEQLTSDPPNPTSQQLNVQVTNLPVFVHQGDIPAIVPPAGLTGAPERGVLLSGGIPDDVFALISLSPARPDDTGFSFTNGNGLAKTPHPVFQIRFKNRSTIWQYVNKQTSAVNSTELNPLPLTRFGNAGTKQKPSEGWVKADKSGAKITRLVSEIFV